MTRPLVLVDFDGVFNIVAPLEMANETWVDAKEYIIPVPIDESGVESYVNFVTRISPTVLAFFSRLVDADVADVEWLTSWRQDTEQFPKALGIPEMVWHDEPEGTEFFPWWKLQIVKSLDDEAFCERPILWVDDDIRHDGDTQAWLPQHRHIKSMSTVSFKGITPPQLVEISDFIEFHTGATIYPNAN